MKPDTRPFYVEMVQGAIERIAGSLDEALDLGELARTAGLSPFHFHRIFRGMVGETPLELARRLRLERAAWQLSRSAEPVTDIAFAAGYETHEAFTRSFKGAFSVSPSGFRQKDYRRVALPATSGIHFAADRGVTPFIPRDSGGQHMQVEIVDMPDQRAACLRHVGPYSQISKAFEQLGAIGGQARLFERPGIALVALYHDDTDSVPLDQLRSDACIVVPDGVPVPQGLSEQKLPAGRYAKTVHRGPYEQLGDAWARFLGEWLPSSGHRLGDGPSFELYRNTPIQVPKDQLITELYAPLSGS